MNNIFNKLQFNEVISISSIIILYEIIVLFLYLINIIKYNLCRDLISPLILLNIFIILVMFLTSCKIDTYTKMWVVCVKLILLFIILSFIANFSYKNYFIGFLLLFIYFIFSNINKVYSCNVKMINLLKSFIFSTLIYLFLIKNSSND